MSSRETIIITGASQGVGKATALKLLHANRDLVLIARNKESLEKVCDEVIALGGHAKMFVADLSNRENALQVCTEILQTFGKIDCLILNAGVSNNCLFTDSTFEKLDYEHGVNYIAPMSILKVLLFSMRGNGRGHIIHVSSLTTIVPFPGNASYSASKAAFFHLLRNIRIEFRNSDINFSFILPGYTKTAMTADLDSVLSKFLPKALTPEDIAQEIDGCLKNPKTSHRIPGWSNKLVVFLFRLFPVTAEAVISRFAELLVPNYAKLTAEKRQTMKGKNHAEDQ